MSYASDALQDLRRQFAATLPGKLKALRARQQKLSLSDWQPADVQALYQQLHGLTGSAGTFGLRSVSAAARQLEIRLKAIVEAGTAPDADAWAAMGAELGRIEALAHSRLQAGAPSLNPPEGRPRLDADSDRAPRVYLVEDDAEQAEHLAQTLDEDGYQVRVFTALNDFRAALGRDQPPDAIVLDMIFPEGDDAGAALLAELKAEWEDCPPVVFASVRDELDARLAAYRAGASRYLLKPIDPPALIDLLDALTGRVPPQPYRVLLVDDDPMLLETHSSVLRAAGMTVQALDQPRDALDTLDAFRPDVVVLDVYMPEVSGPELAAIVRERDDYLNLPILFLSAETDMSQQLLALNLGGDDFLVKPVQPEHLVSAVTARARRARQNAAVQRRLAYTLYEREREHLALNHHAIVIIADRAGNITYANDKFSEISGYARRELIGQNVSILQSGEHPPEFYPGIWCTIARGEVWHGEICNRRRDGSLYWVESTITPFMDESGKPYQYVSIHTDITQAKENEATQKLVREAAGALLSAGADEVDATIEHCLQQAGKHLGADRAYLFLLDDDGAHIRNSHEWCAAGIAPQKDKLQYLPLQEIAWWWAQMEHVDVIHISDVAALPPEAAAFQAHLESQDIRALCGLSFQRDNKTAGFVGLDQVTKTREWKQDALDLMALMTDQIGSAVVRAAYEREIESQQRFTQSVLDSISAHIAVLNGDGVIVAVNEPWQRFAAGNAQQAGASVPNTDIGTNYLDVCRQSDIQDADDVHTGIHSVMSGDAPRFRHEYACHSPSKERWFEMTVMPLANDGGGVVISHVTTTERKQAQQAVEAVKERLRRGQMYANIGTWEWNIVTGDLFWTECIAPLFGYPQGDLETSYENFLAAVHPDDRQAVIDAVDACIEHDQPYGIEHRVLWPDGTVRWLLEHGAVQRDAEGKPLQMIGVVQDIDDRKRAEMTLAEREQQLLEAQKLASIGNWSANLSSGELVWSDEIYSIFGHEPGSFAPSVEAFRAAVHPDDRGLVHESEREAEKTGHFDLVHRILLPDGRVRYVHELAKMQLDESGKPLRLTGSVQDVTELKQAEQELIQAKEEADRANQAKSDFLSSMSHELRTPMNAILGFSQLLELDDSLPGEHRENVSEILRAGEHLLELINEVLDLAKIESGHIKLSLDSVEFCPVLEECLSLVGEMAERRGIRISHRCRRGTRVRADRTRLKQALLNLISNAVKYNRAGGSVEIEARPAGAGRLRVLVRDTGAGIPQDRLAGLFQPFNRLGAEDSEIEGTGIGLTITRRIVELMGGTVDAESEVGAGSTFWIELPLEAKDEASQAGEDSPAASPPGSTDGGGVAGGRRVLYIEDNPANLKLVSQLLGRVAQVELLTAHTPELGMELARARRPDLILLDINLPGMDGYRVLELIRTEVGLEDTPVIAITANAMPQDIERGRAAGFADYLTKPLDVGQFLGRVRRCLGEVPT